MANTNLENKNLLKESPITKETLKCDLCSFKTTWRVNLKRHQSSVHFSTSFACAQCEYKTTRKSTLNAHVKTAHEGRTLKCDMCSFTAGMSQTLKRHKASKHEMKRFKCEQCDFSATRKEHLRTHEMTEHLGGLFKCELCPFTAKWKPNMKRHVEAEHSGLSFNCSDCPYRTKLKSHLKLHCNRKHSEALPLKCDKCPYTTPSKQTLKKHYNRLHHNTDQHVTFSSATSIDNSCEQPRALLEHVSHVSDHVSGKLSPDQLVTDQVTHDLTGLEIHQLENGSTVLLSKSDPSGGFQQNTFAQQDGLYYLLGENCVVVQPSQIHHSAVLPTQIRNKE